MAALLHNVSLCNVIDHVTFQARIKELPMGRAKWKRLLDSSKLVTFFSLNT